MAKLTRRERYILKWNGPNCVKDKKKNYRHANATRGHGDVTTRSAGTAYYCRFRGFFPATVQEFERLAGIAG